MVVWSHRRIDIICYHAGGCIRFGFPVVRSLCSEIEKFLKVIISIRKLAARENLRRLANPKNLCDDQG